uniref:Uncharacterized protein n=1 Tax=Oryza rufipogon TaxID=4529 RepID=A0A0E0PXJ5_ORYRU
MVSAVTHRRGRNQGWRRRPDLRKKELDLFNDDASARFLWWACYWDLGEDGGPVVRKETHRMDRNGIAMHDGALDVGSDVELGTRCEDDVLSVMRMTLGSHNGLVPLNFGETRLLLGF